MRGQALGLALYLLASGCASLSGSSERSEVIRRFLPSTVQLRSERTVGVRRAASGIVLAADASS